MARILFYDIFLPTNILCLRHKKISGYIPFYKYSMPTAQINTIGNSFLQIFYAYGTKHIKFLSTNILCLRHIKPLNSFLQIFYAYGIKPLEIPSTNILCLRHKIIYSNTSYLLQIFYAYGIKSYIPIRPTFYKYSMPTA